MWATMTFWPHSMFGFHFRPQSIICYVFPHGHVLGFALGYLRSHRYALIHSSPPLTKRSALALGVETKVEKKNLVEALCAV